MHNIYISGISSDNVHVQHIKDIIEREFGNAKCWIDIADNMSSGFSSMMGDKSSMPKPNEYEMAIYVASQESRRSEWVFRELLYFMKMEIPLYAVVIDDLDFSTLGRADMFEGYCTIHNTSSLISSVKKYLATEDYDIFISYSRKDYEKVNELRKNLERLLPGLKCWFDLDGIENGDEFETKIVSAIEKSKILLFAYSENSKESNYAQREVTFAHNVGKRIVPVIIDGSKLSGWFLFRFGNISFTDLNDKKQFHQLINNLGHWFGLKPFEEKPIEDNGNKPFGGNGGDLPEGEEEPLTLIEKIRYAFTQKKRYAIGLILALCICVFCVLHFSSPQSLSDHYKSKVHSEFADKARQYDADSRYLVIVDFSILSNNPRLFIWDTQKDEIVEQFLCAHGKGGGSTPEQPVFSNVNGSNCSSLGWFEINSNVGWSNTYQYYYHAVKGLDYSNSNAQMRGIVIHAWKDSVDQFENKKSNKPMPLGVSEGNFTISQKGYQTIERYLNYCQKPMLLWAIDGI